jgi:hypothetical protein
MGLDQVRYIFHRGRHFYCIKLNDDHDAIANAKCNKGTTLVTDMAGNVIWCAEGKKDKKSKK